MIDSMKTPQPQVQSQPSNLLFNNPDILQAFSVVISGLLISCSILFATGIISDISTSLWSLAPKFNNYNSLKEIRDYENVDEVLGSQPKISVNNNARILLVETSDMGCINCAKFHGFESTDDQFGYSKLKSDYINTGKVEYIFIDKLIFNSNEKHNAAYCVAEQSPSAFFDFKDRVYKNFNNEFNLENSKKFINSFNFDLKKYEECYKSNKYESRVKGINNFSSDVLGVSSTPSFHIFRIQKKEVTKSNGDKSIEAQYTRLQSIVGNSDFDIYIKPELDKYINEYK